MTESARPTAARDELAMLVGVCCGFFALALLGLAWTKDVARGPVLWLPNALLIAILFAGAPRRFPARLAAGWAGGAAALLLVGGSAWHLACYAVISLIEIVIVHFGVRRGRPRVNFADLRLLLRFSLVAGVVAPTASAIVSTAPTLAGGGRVDPGELVAWGMSHGLGLLIGTPLFVIIADGWRARHRLSRRQVGEAAAVLTLSLGVTAGVFAQSSFPILFLACPVVLVAAFRLGLFGTAISIALISFVALVATAWNVGPITLVHGSLATRLLILQLFLATNFALGLPVATMLRGLERTRRALSESRDFARSMLENMREVIFRTDADGRWVSLNPAWEALTGYSVAESLGRRTTCLLHPDDLAEAAAVYPRLVAGEIDELTLNQRFFSADGKCHYIEVSVRALRDEDGRFAGTIGNIRDISERHRAEQALRDSERRFQTLAAMAPVGIFRADVDGNATYFNAAWSALSGLTQEEGLGMGWRVAVAPEDRERVMKGWRTVVADRVPRRGEYRFQRPDGSSSWTDSICTPELDENGAVVGHIGVYLDITERKLSERSAAEREALLTLLASNATDAVFRLSLDGVCLYASPSVGEVIGIAPRLLIGQNMLDRFHPDDHDRVVAAHQALARGEAERLVVSYRSEPMDRPGDWKWLEANTGLVRNPTTGAPQEIIASIRDISERKALEHELEAARDAAQVAVSAKASFLANMSHEIRTPMNGVIGFTELLLASELTADQRGQVQLVADSGKAMMRLLNDILDISKIEAGQMLIARDPINLRHAVGGCLKLMGPLASEKGLALDCRFDERIPAQVLGDGLRLRQIVLNLLGNALKFTETGSVRVLAGAHPDDPDVIEIEVRDTGIGIAPDRQQAIFEQFVQSDVSVARKYGGSGLGLAISHQLAGLMGGELTMTSEPAVGTSFFLRLPLPAVSLERYDLPALEAVAAPVDDASMRRVLVAEDNEINQLLARAMLERLGCAVTMVGDGAGAVDEIDRAMGENAPFDLILMDIQMPDVDGLEATRLIRAKGYSADRLPIVALTANAYPDDIQACRDAGMQDHLVKPLQISDLASIMHRWGNAGTARRRSAA